MRPEVWRETRRGRIQRLGGWLLLLGLASVAHADYWEGLAAYDRGDYPTAYREWLPLAKQGDPESQYRMGRLYQLGRGVDRDPAAAVDWYTKAADQGHARAQTNLGLMYDTGQGVGEDDVEAAKWYRLAADQGRAAAQYNLGLLEERNNDDPLAALEWYRPAAAAGYAPAQYQLGWLYETGRGVARDDVLAVDWYRKAARQDHAEAQYRLGWMFIDGRGVKANSKKASKWFARASELGISVDRGRPSDIPDPSTDALAASVPAAAAAAPDEPAPAATDPAPAVVATQAPPPEEEAREAKDATTDSPATEPPTASETAPVAAAAGTGAAAAAPAEGSEDLDAEAMYDLGNRYHSGNGVPRDPFVAAEWYERAAEQGHGMAAYRLAFMYLRGRGPATKNDYPRAYFWFDVAAGEGVGDAAEWQTKISAKMSRRELEEARELLVAAGRKVPE